MPSTQRLLYRSERIATEPGLPELVNAAGERTPHFAFRRGTFSRIESTMELARVIETRGYSSCVPRSPAKGEGQPRRGRYDDISLTFYHIVVIISCVYTRGVFSRSNLLMRQTIPLSGKSFSTSSKVDRARNERRKREKKKRREKDRRACTLSSASKG